MVRTFTNIEELVGVAIELESCWKSLEKHHMNL
jgi:hypothetical protein